MEGAWPHLGQGLDGVKTMILGAESPGARGMGLRSSSV